ncbi:Predicted transcriptional regulator [Blautia obeum]|jgi:excisionase family DNA binding protein|uniref:Predicted transcriptional regulator n=2 Tax=Blautia TaxID=572511 RepID=A0A173WBW0_9FIRM|nr:helix-turn-helix domain-containing protein [Blautia sp. LMAG:36]CUN36510.1 Predicted transcriptional regulator [Blautia obeum]
MEGVLLDTNMANINDVERWLSLEEISKHVGCSKDTIRAWIKKDTIPYHKVGRMYKFKISEVDAWIESGQSADADK